MGRPLKRRTSSEIIDIVEKIRRRNNHLWMGLLRLAVQTKPRKAKKLVREIVENDRKVSEWMARL
jgi:hypothetical protein